MIARYPEYNLGHIDLDSSTWAKSLFKRMGFVKRMSTARKVEIPDRAKNEAQFVYLHDIVTISEEHKVPSCLILNLDQTHVKYIPVGRQSLAKEDSKSVSISDFTEKRLLSLAKSKRSCKYKNINRY